MRVKRSRFVRTCVSLALLLGSATPRPSAGCGKSQEKTRIRQLRHVAVSVLVAGSLFTLPLTPVAAAPTEIIQIGLTTVRLAPEFLQALDDLKVNPRALSPGLLLVDSQGAQAVFPVTTGAVDLGTVQAEIDHAGGLALTAGETHVKLSSFIIDLAGSRPVLTGLVVVNDDLVARLPLFDLSLETAQVGRDNDVLTVENVKVILSEEAAGALNQVFNVQALTPGIPIGHANVRAILEFTP
jgi:hypothetical protein